MLLPRDVPRLHVNHHANIRAGLPLAPPQLESSHRVLDVWLWLSFRFPDAWVGGEEVAERRVHLAQLIDASIRSMGLPRWGPLHKQAGWLALMLGSATNSEP